MTTTTHTAGHKAIIAWSTLIHGTGNDRHDWAMQVADELDAHGPTADLPPFPSTFPGTRISRGQAARRYYAAAEAEPAAAPPAAEQLDLFADVEAELVQLPAPIPASVAQVAAKTAKRLGYAWVAVCDNDGDALEIANGQPGPSSPKPAWRHRRTGEHGCQPTAQELDSAAFRRRIRDEEAARTGAARTREQVGADVDVEDIIERALEDAGGAGLTPSAAAARASTSTDEARRVLQWMVANRFAHTSGRGAWTRYHAGHQPTPEA